MQRDLTQGPIRRGLILFSLPLIAGHLLQQLCTRSRRASA